jgi:hypothetical protein
MADSGFGWVRPAEVVERGVLIVQSDRRTDQACGQIAAAKLVSHDAKKMKGLKVVRVDRENFSVAVFGFRELAGLMVLLASRQLVGNVTRRTDDPVLPYSSRELIPQLVCRSPLFSVHREDPHRSA